MRTIKMSEAINEALREEMRRDPRVFVIGEDVGQFNGSFQVTKGLLDEFGEERVRDTPLSEAAIIGCAVGAALMGWRPVAEIQYSDFVACGFDQLVNQAAKVRLMSGGQASVPMVVRMPIGARERGAQHDQCPEAWFMHTPGLKVAIPSTAYDAKGLLKTAIRDDNPVVFCEHKLLYGAGSASARSTSGAARQAGQLAAGGVPVEEYLIPFGVADVKREGDDVTIVATALMVHRALEAARELEGDGISVEVVDPRTLVPLDRKTILSSVEKTGRALVVTEETRTASCAAEIAALIAEEGFDFLDAPVMRMGTLDTPIPFAPLAQRFVLPGVPGIVSKVRQLISRKV
jgi:pyruvate dehydrogenase E1 component beta subunit